MSDVNLDIKQQENLCATLMHIFGKMTGYNPSSFRPSRASGCKELPKHSWWQHHPGTQPLWWEGV